MLLKITHSLTEIGSSSIPQRSSRRERLDVLTLGRKATPAAPWTDATDPASMPTEQSEQLQQLKNIFPQLELIVLVDLLEANHHDIERAAAAAFALIEAGAPPSEPAPHPVVAIAYVGA